MVWPDPLEEQAQTEVSVRHARRARAMRRMVGLQSGVTLLESAPGSADLAEGGGTCRGGTPWEGVGAHAGCTGGTNSEAWGACAGLTVPPVGRRGVWAGGGPGSS